MCLLDLFGSGSGNLKSQNLKSVPPCACFHGFFSRVLGFPVTMLHTLLAVAPIAFRCFCTSSGLRGRLLGRFLSAAKVNSIWLLKAAGSMSPLFTGHVLELLDFVLRHLCWFLSLSLSSSLFSDILLPCSDLGAG